MSTTVNFFLFFQRCYQFFYFGIIKKNILFNISMVLHKILIQCFWVGVTTSSRNTHQILVTETTRQVHYLFQDLWNRFINFWVGIGCKVLSCQDQGNGARCIKMFSFYWNWKRKVFHRDYKKRKYDNLKNE